MYDLAAFSKRVKELYRQSYPYDDRRQANQTDLANAVGLSMTELNRRLNGARGAQLTERDVRAIVRTLAEWGAITTQAEALNLLELVCCAQFSASEWNAPPLDSLAPLRPANQPTPAPPIPAPRAKTNLPLALTSFVGREREQAEVARLLEDNRLLTLVGPGGVGKTRLALVVTASLATRFSDGVWLVELAGISDPELVPQALASVLHVTEQAGKPLLETLLEALEGRETLLILDNCEHLLLPVARTVHRLLSYCPSLRVLTTSREGLHINGEALFSVPPLGLPTDRTRRKPSRLTRYPAIRLFVARAQARQSQFLLSEDNATKVSDICQRLDGLPLAIELAAARVETMSVADIQAGLADRFALLTEGDRIALPRQQTLYALIDWSYTLLDADEQRLFTALGVFAGGFVLEAAEAVAASQNDVGSSMAVRLGRLADKSLIVRAWSGDEGRYGMLETIREYALQQLHGTLEVDIRERHAEYYRQLAEQGEQQLRGAAQALWLTRLEQEHDNIRAALTWALAHNAETAARLASAMRGFWDVRGYLNEGRRWLDAALNNQGSVSAETRAWALYNAGKLAHTQCDISAASIYLHEALAQMRQLGNQQGIFSALSGLGGGAFGLGDYPTAQGFYEQSLLIARQLGDQRGIGVSLYHLGLIARTQGNHEAARQLYEESLALLRSVGDSFYLSLALNNLALVVYMQGDAATSRALNEQSLTLRRELGNKLGIAISLQHLGDIACVQGDYAAARRFLDESLTIGMGVGSKTDVANTLICLGSLACCEGDYRAARQCYKESLGLFREVKNKYGIASSLIDLGSVAALRPDPAARRAACLLGSGHNMIVSVEGTLFPSERAVYERALTACHATLSEEEFSQAWNAGAAMKLEQAIAYALEEDSQG